MCYLCHPFAANLSECVVVHVDDAQLFVVCEGLGDELDAGGPNAVLRHLDLLERANELERVGDGARAVELEAIAAANEDAQLEGAVAVAPALLESVRELLGALRAEAVVVHAYLLEREAARALEELHERLEADRTERVVGHVYLDETRAAHVHRAAHGAQRERNLVLEPAREYVVANEALQLRMHAQRRAELFGSLGRDGVAFETEHAHRRERTDLVDERPDVGGRVELEAAAGIAQLVRVDGTSLGQELNVGDIRFAWRLRRHRVCGLL